jgi:hypothetical protein
MFVVASYATGAGAYVVRGEIHSGAGGSCGSPGATPDHAAEPPGTRPTPPASAAAAKMIKLRTRTGLRLRPCAGAACRWKTTGRRGLSSHCCLIPESSPTAGAVRHCLLVLVLHPYIVMFIVQGRIVAGSSRFAGVRVG